MALKIKKFNNIRNITAILVKYHLKELNIYHNTINAIMITKHHQKVGRGEKEENQKRQVWKDRLYARKLSSIKVN